MTHSSHLHKLLEHPTALGSHLARFQRPAGSDLLARTAAFGDWVESRRTAGVWPYSRSLTAEPRPATAVRDETGALSAGANFASQDYLGLSTHAAVRHAVIDALDRFGPHSAGSPVLLGNTSESLALEHELGAMLHMPDVLLFPTGWAAGFSAVHALVRDADHVLLDERAHACLQQGARSATPRVSLTRHLDVGDVEDRLRRIRESDARNGILVVTEGLFSMDADRPDLAALQRTCRHHGATLLVDVAHDFGATGPDGLGALGLADMVGQVDLVMGSFSKTFASNGGFIAAPNGAVKQFLKLFGGAHMFSNALSPTQAAAVRAALRVVRSTEGDMLRQRNAQVASTLRAECRRHGLEVLGQVSPIVPVVVGGNRLARVASALLADSGVLANLVEFPAVPLNSTRFRFQVMASHTSDQAVSAADTLALVVDRAQALLEELDAHTREPEASVR